MLKRSAVALGSLAFSAGLLFACANSSSGGGNNNGPPDSSVSNNQDSGMDSSPDSSMPVLVTDTGTMMGMGIIPTTCSQANGSFGCCGPNGENYYCGGDAGTVSSESCTGKTTEAGAPLVCGWNSKDSYYGCVAPPASADPSGAEPLSCGAAAGDSGTTVTDSGAPADSGLVSDSGPAGDSGTVTDSGTPTDGGGGSIPTTCAQAYDVVGCCGPNGDNYYCAADAGTVTMKACSAAEVCGWNATKMYYGCVTGPSTSDPSGVNPIACQ
jgi:hypothetical protein